MGLGSAPPRLFAARGEGAQRSLFVSAQPLDYNLRVGTTASVLVRSGTSGEEPIAPRAAPSILQ